MIIKPLLAIIFASLIVKAIAVACAENRVKNSRTTSVSDILLGYASGAIVHSSKEIAYFNDSRMYIKVDLEDFWSNSQRSIEILEYQK